MRPADHPDFFKLPPPEGRSRESSIRLHADGHFSHDGAPVEHPGMARAFASWIARHPDDGRYVLSNGWDWTYFTVEDVPYFVERVFERDGAPWLELSDGTEEALDATTLEADGDALYLRVKGGEFAARFQRHAQLALAPWLEELPAGEVALRIGAKRHPFSEREIRGDRG
jgi:hypothetical protein